MWCISKRWRRRGGEGRPGEGPPPPLSRDLLPGGGRTWVVVRRQGGGYRNVGEEEVVRQGRWRVQIGKKQGRRRSENVENVGRRRSNEGGGARTPREEVPRDGRGGGRYTLKFACTLMHVEVRTRIKLRQLRSPRSLKLGGAALSVIRATICRFVESLFCFCCVNVSRTRGRGRLHFLSPPKG